MGPVELRRLTASLERDDYDGGHDERVYNDRRDHSLDDEANEAEMRDYATLEAGPLDADAERMERLDRATVRKLDTVLLPFLALLFLFNSLDRSNIGNAETADFTKDVGLQPSDLNDAVAVFFAFFVTLQPVGAALGRKYGMAVWVPSCMALWGLCTALHIWVRTKWQLILLRMVIGTLEAGFYPVTVSYLSLFYTRFEFARRLGLFYGQYAVAGAMGGLLAAGVFTHFPTGADIPTTAWRPWQVLFALEGGVTVVLALVGFVWLPHNARTAWFLTPEQRGWAEERIARDRQLDESAGLPRKGDDAGEEREEETAGLLAGPSTPTAAAAPPGGKPVTDDRGLSRGDVFSALLDWKLWYLLFCNILSAVPATAFSVFLPLVLRQLTSSPAHVNLLTAPPFLCGAGILYAFTYWSDKVRKRIMPILWGLGLLLVGLVGVVVFPAAWMWARYVALCVLLGGTFIASPLTIAWFAGNVPETGKRAVVLGVNGWGNLAGVFSALLFRPKYGPTYEVPFFVTLGLVGVAFAGYAGFGVLIARENRERKAVVARWGGAEVEAEQRLGRGPSEAGPVGSVVRFVRAVAGEGWARRVGGYLGEGEGRRGDERLTFLYGL
ncbi:MFS general substrate transporter, partial [Trichodelitschia bisporula]